ncbi:unnamed protein product [Closterium sp. NIES-53]
MDVCGPMRHASKGGARFLLVMLDDATRMCWTRLLKAKGDVTKAIQEWALEVCDDDKKRIKAIRTDGGGEFVNAELEKWMKSKGIKHDVTTPYTPQQNRAAERLNRTLVEAVRSLLQHSKLGSEWWGEASSLAAWIRNCLPMKVLPEMTPFEAWTGMKPNLSRLHTFGCLCYYHVLDPLRHKLQSKARAAIYLGIAVNERSWRVWDLGERRVVTSRDVVFDEDKFPKKEQPTPQLTVILPAQEEDEAMEVPSQVEKKAENGGGENEESDDDVVEVSSTAAATSSTPSSLPLALTREQRTRRPNTKYTATTLRVLLALVATLNLEVEQLDVCTAFLYGLLVEVVYMQQPPGYDDGSGRVWKLKRTLYGLKQSPRGWYKRIDTFLLQHGFARSECDSTLYVLKEGEKQLVLLFYVDDLLLFSDSKDLIREVKQRLGAEFAMRDLGPVTYYLGMHVDRDQANGTIHLHQDKYVKGVVDSFGMGNSKPVGTVKHPHRQAEPRRPAAPRSQEPSRTARPSRAALLSLRRHTEPHYPARATPAATAVSAATAATAATAAMASPIVLTFDAEGRAVDFDVWVDDMQLFLQCDSKDGVSLFYHTSGVSPTPAATADSMVRSQWTTRDAVARLDVLTRYSSPATAALSRLMLPYLFPDLAAFATVADLITRLRTSDARYRAALPTEFCAKNLAPQSESFGSDLPVLRLHSDIGSEFPSDLLRAFYRAEGIRQTFTLPASPQQNGIAERYIGMVMDVARMSMIHAAAPHFLWPFAVQYAAHLINLQPHVSFPETTPTLRWTGKVGDASVFRVKGSRAFIRDTSADKLSSCAVLCVFLGFPPDAPGWQFYHPTSRRVLSSQDVTFDESVSYYRLFPYRTAPLPPPPLFLAPGAPLVDPLPPQGPAPSGVLSLGLLSLRVRSLGVLSVEPGGAEPGGAKSGGAEPGGAEPERAKSGGPPGVPSRREPLSPQQLCEWYARRCSRAAGATGPTAGAAGAAGPGGAGAGGTGAVGGPASVGAAGGAIAAGSGGARTGGTGATGAGGAAGVGAGVVGGAAGAGGTGVVGGPAGVGATGGVGAGAVATGGAARAGAARGTGAGGAAGVVAGDPGVDGTGAVSAVSGGAARPRPYYVPLLQQVLGLPPSTGPTPPLLSPPPVQSQSQLQPASPLPGPSPYSGPTRGLTERREPESRPASPESRPASLESSPESPVRTVRTGRRVPHQLPPPVPGTHSMTLRPSTAPQRLPLPTPPASSLPDGPYPESDSLRAASPPVTRFLTSVVTDPSFESAAASALVAELVDFAAACRLDYAASLVAESKSAFVCPPSVQGQPARGDLAALRCPLGFTGSFPAGTQWSLRRPVYGLCQAPREWHDTLKTTLAALGFAPSTADPLLFLRTDTTLPPFYVLVYVDDLVFATADTEGFAHMNSEQQKRHTCTDLGELTSYLGWRITRDRAQRTITLTQSQVECRSFSADRPDLAYPLSLLARYVAPGRHRKVHWDAAKRVLRYLCSTLGMGLVLGGRARVVLAGHADASWVDELATLRSSQGYTFSLGSGSVSWRSTRSSSVLSSSCEAEIYVGAMAAQELRWLTYLLTDLGEAPRYPPVLYVDNKVMLALCQEHRLEHRTKHIALRYFLARELQQRGQLRLAYVAIQANTADIFTKALQPCDHQRFCIMLACFVFLDRSFDLLFSPTLRMGLSCCPSVRPSIVATIVPHSPMDSSQQSSAAGDETKCRPEEAREGENGQGEEFHDVEEQNGHHKQEHDSHDNNHNHHHHHHHLRLPFHHHQPTPEEEAAKVEELRAAIGPVDGAIALFCTDACLRRYLRARSWHVKKAEKMLLETIAWRRAFTPERIRWADVAKESETGKVYRAPFTDKLGRPVLVLCPGKQNTDDHDGNIRQMVYCMENAVQSLPEGVEQMVWIIDYKGFTLRKSPPMKTSREVLHILQNHYPERLGAAILFDPPYIFQGLWKVIRPFIDPVTFQKIKFVYRKSLPSLKVMEELFDTSLLDPALGGKGDAYVYDHASYSSRMEADDERTAKLWELDGINGAASGSGTAAV